MILREIAGEHILVPTGETAEKLNGLMNLNDSGLLLWNRLQKDCTEKELVDSILDEYEVDRATAEADVREFLAQMVEAGIVV